MRSSIGQRMEKPPAEEDCAGSSDELKKMERAQRKSKDTCRSPRCFRQRGWLRVFSHDSERAITSRSLTERTSRRRTERRIRPSTWAANSSKVRQTSPQNQRMARKKGHQNKIILFLFIISNSVTTRRSQGTTYKISINKKQRKKKPTNTEESMSNGNIQLRIDRSKRHRRRYLFSA